MLAEVSAEWWTGRNAAGQTGLFPSNYVVLDGSPAAIAVTSSSPAPERRKLSSRRETVPEIKPSFTSATLKDFPIQFKMPSQKLPSMRIGANDSTAGHAARDDAKRKIAELNKLLLGSK